MTFRIGQSVLWFLFLVILTWFSGCAEDEVEWYTFDYEEELITTASADSTYLVLEDHGWCVPAALDFQAAQSEALGDTLRIVLGIIGESHTPERAVTEYYWEADTLFVWCSVYGRPDYSLGKVETEKTSVISSCFALESVAISFPPNHGVRLIERRHE